MKFTCTFAPIKDFNNCRGGETTSVFSKAEKSVVTLLPKRLSITLTVYAQEIPLPSKAQRFTAISARVCHRMAGNIKLDG